MRRSVLNTTEYADLRGYADCDQTVTHTVFGADGAQRVERFTYTKKALDVSPECNLMELSEAAAAYYAPPLAVGIPAYGRRVRPAPMLDDLD